MDKMKILLKMQKVLHTILEQMSMIENDINIIVHCIKDKKLITDDVLIKTVTRLQEIKELNAQYQILYQEINLNQELPEKIKEIEKVLVREIKDLELKEQLLKYKKFLCLKTKDPETEILLNAKKEDLKAILEEYTVDKETELKFYEKFIKAVVESDSANIIDYIVELSPVFGNKLLGKAFISKTIYVPEDEEKESIVERSFDKTKENKIEEMKESDIEIYGLLITEDICSENFYVNISEAENKKFGVKNFLHDVKAKYTMGNILSMEKLSKYSCVTAELISVISEVSVEQEKIECSLNYLQTKGYIRKYGIETIGSFYCTSPRGEKALLSKDARSFLKIKGITKKDEEECIQDGLHPVLNRIAYTKLLTRYFQCFNTSMKMSELIMTDSFAVKIVDIDQDKNYILMGVFWGNEKEVEYYLKELKNVVADVYENLVIAAINQIMAKKLADYLAKKLKLDKKKMICYALIENIFFDYLKEEELQLESILNRKEEETIKESKKDVSIELSIKEEIAKSFEETTAAEETIEEAEKALEKTIPTTETVKSSIEKSVEKIGFKETVSRESIEKINMDEVMSNVFQMIIDKKIYCAMTYLCSLMENQKKIENMYRQLAYAVNAPWMRWSYHSQEMMRCSYHSQEIFSLYSGETDIFLQYLMVTATLRNFFMNHVGYDYNMKALYANVKEIPTVNGNMPLMNAIYKLTIFKEKIHKGIDFYADYKVKDHMAVKHELESLVAYATSYYSSYVEGERRETISNKRFIETRKKVFSKEDNIAFFLQVIINKEYEVVELMKEYLKNTFIKNDCSIEYSNLDSGKLNSFIDMYWNRAGDTMRDVRRTSDLMSRLRNNLLNAIEKVLHVMCDWIVLVEGTSTLKEDDGTRQYKDVRKDLLLDINNAISNLQKKHSFMATEELAGAIVLEDTLQELISRLDGTYDERKNKYYYIDFLRGNQVLLEENTYFPDMRGKFGDFQELSLSNRVLKHAKETQMSFEEKLDYIFNQYGDDYGTAELIVNYLEDMGKSSYSKKYNIKKFEELAKSEAKLKLESFIENLELAQSYGQIEEAKENKKEKIQKIANEWFLYAKESKNYGFFNMVLDQYEKKIREDAEVRGKALLKELEQIKQSDINENTQKRILKIQEMIQNQNYTVAEDLLSRINSNESDEAIEVANTDYLKKFIKEYDYNYGMAVDSSRSLKGLVQGRTYNKDLKGGRRLVDNWMSNGWPLGQKKLYDLLDALGFIVAEVRENAKIENKIENYFVKTKTMVGRKVNYKHPIAAFGSKASEDGFRVVCLFGRYDADRLIEEFKNITGWKHTLVLLDYALPLADRRRLARKIKSDLNDKVFAVLDRVLVMFLVNNYNVQFINQILMSVIMPFSYYQPYVWDSSKVMPPEIFIGRKNELEKIESPAGINIVYGGRQLGKSALLKMAKMNIDRDEAHNRAVLVEIKGLDFEKAAKKIGHALYDAEVLTEDIDTTDWDDLARVIKRRLQDKQLPYIPYLLLLLDEADAFIDSCSKEEVNFRPFDALKDIQSIGSDRFKFVIAGLHNIVRFKRDAALSNNSVLTHLTSITVKPFDKREGRLLLEEPLHYLGFRFPEDKQSLISLILANTNYFPGLIQLYCANLIEAMRDSDYAGYDQVDTPIYEIKENHIKKVLSDADFMDQIREKFEITLKLDKDNKYYIIALLMAYLYHQNANSALEIEGFSARDIVNAGKEYEIKELVNFNETMVDGLMQELLELNILRQTVHKLYLFSRYSFFQMMGTLTEVEDKLLEYMLMEE